MSRAASVGQSTCGRSTPSAAYASISASTRARTSSSAYDACTAARARSAMPASSRSSRSAAMAYSWLRLVPNIGGSSELIVTVTPASRNAAQRVLGERRDRAGGDVRGRADLQRDAGLGEVGEQRGVLGGRGAVADPLGAQQLERVPDRLGPGRLPRVRQAAQAGGAGGVEVRLELRPRHADLRPAEAEADQAVGPVLAGRTPASTRRPAARPRRGCRRSSAAPGRSPARPRRGRPRSPRCRPRWPCRRRPRAAAPRCTACRSARRSGGSGPSPSRGRPRRSGSGCPRACGPGRRPRGRPR